MKCGITLVSAGPLFSGRISVLFQQIGWNECAISFGKRLPGGELLFIAYIRNRIASVMIALTIAEI